MSERRHVGVERLNRLLVRVRVRFRHSFTEVRFRHSSTEVRVKVRFRWSNQREVEPVPCYPLVNPTDKSTYT